jgi:acetyltransferase-like isoleucine patch superfamily enzyme
MLFASEHADITIEDDVMLGSGVHIYVNDHRFTEEGVPIIAQGHSPAAAVVLKRGCWVGANAVLLPGVSIGENAVIGAGSVVTRDAPPRTVSVGSPARVVKTIGAAERMSHA